jgi:hypothetical protein
LIVDWYSYFTAKISNSKKINLYLEPTVKYFAKIEKQKAKKEAKEK